MPFLDNTARVDATINTLDTWDVSSFSVEIPAIKVHKTANMTIWQGDVLSYTITLTNLDEVYEATDIIFTDTIDPTLAKLIPTSVYVNGVNIVRDSGYTYLESTGLLRITAMPDIPPTENYDVTFQVTKV